MEEKGKAVIMALHYLPEIGWFTNLMKYEQLWLEKCEHFVKSSARNRCEILTAQGRQRLSIPIAGGREQKKLYTAIQIDNNKNWQHQHWQSLQTAYGKAPYFEDYAPWFAPFYQQKFTLLWEFNRDLLQLCLKLLQLHISFQFTESFVKPGEFEGADVRYAKVQTQPNLPPYYQGFTRPESFEQHLSILDLLFHLGPASKAYLKQAASYSAVS